MKTFKKSIYETPYSESLCVETEHMFLQSNVPGDGQGTNPGYGGEEDIDGYYGN